jgi:predicted ATP-dependent endonuclease of OLD family
MLHIDKVQIRNYRCISKLEIDQLAPITILVGRNNTGKSALLEALALASTADAGWHDSLDHETSMSIFGTGAKIQIMG